MPIDSKAQTFGQKAESMHKIVVSQRNSALITGVTDVISFDENGIIADTESGVLIIKGNTLHVNKLNLDRGELDLDGEIDSLVYNEGGRGKSKQSLLSKIFR